MSNTRIFVLLQKFQAMALAEAKKGTGDGILLSFSTPVFSVLLSEITIM
jgi:hypothetical protein